MEKSTNELLTVRKVAKMLKIKEKDVYALIKSKRVEAVKILGRIRISSVEVNRIIKQGA